MTDISEFTDEQLLPFDGVWDLFREMSASGISQFSEIVIRNLFAQMSLINSYDEIRLSQLEAIYDTQKLSLGLCKSKLLAIKYRDGAMNNRTAEVEADKAYQQEANNLDNANINLVIQKGRVKASAIAANCLSREISARIAK